MQNNSSPLCLIVAIAVLLVSCGKKEVDTAWWEGEQERIELAQRLALKEFRLLQRNGGETGDLAKQDRRNRDLVASLDSLSIRRDTLRGEIESMESEMIGMRDDFLRTRREMVTGKTFETFTAWNGRTYREVSVSSVDDGGVTIRHADGSARLRYGDLSDDQRQLFGLDAERALAATTKERADAIEYEHWIAQRLVANDRKKAERERLAVASERAARIRSSSSSTRTVVAANVSALTNSASQFSSREPRYSRRYDRYRPRRTHYYYPVPVYRNPCVPKITYLNRLPKTGKPNPYKVTRLPYSR